jgi:branched-chain amino acid aminotransferase
MHIERIENSRIGEFDKNNYSFGEIFTDHMFLCEYNNEAWGEPKIVPYGPLGFTPAMMGVNYGQACFEGMKAYKDNNGEVFIFRPDKNFERINKSASRLAMPEIPEEIFMEGLKSLVDLDRNWVVAEDGHSLYLRPVIFATEETLKAKPSSKYLFAIIAAPAKVYYSEPVAVKVADFYSRSASGGVGFAKAAGNYAASFYPTNLAIAEGYDQIIWTDDATHEYIEESGTMNIFCRINDTIYTPPTSERILNGVTRDSFLALAQHNKLKVEVKAIKVAELKAAHLDGSLKEVWGVGTAVVTSQFKAIGYSDAKLDLPVLPESESIAIQLKNQLIGIQTNQQADPFGWRIKIEAKL